MAEIWITSDHHFSHRKILQHGNRPFASVEEMDEALICNWRKLVLIFLAFLILGCGVRFEVYGIDNQSQTVNVTRGNLKGAINESK